MNINGPISVRKNNRRTMIMLGALFGAPILIAFLLYATTDNWLPFLGTKNHGKLISPARPLKDVDLHKLDGSSYRLTDLKGKWILVYFGDAECSQYCQQTLYKIRQSRLAQGEKYKRVHRLYVLLDKSPMESFQAVLQEHQGMDVVTGDSAGLESLLMQFELSGAQTIREAGRVYIIDPLGNLMMSYEKGFDAKELVKDLEHLLRVAQIG